MSRQKIPKAVADELIFKSDRKCCVCGGLGKQIHHIDGDPGNRSIGNLVYLCLDHHDEASKSGGVSRTLTPGLLRRYKSLLFRKVDDARREPRTRKNVTRSGGAESSLYQQAYDASVARTVHDALWTMDFDDWEAVRQWVFQLHRYAYHIDEMATNALLEAMYDIASRAREGMPGSVAQEVKGVCRSFVFPLNSLLSKPANWPKWMKQSISFAAAIGAVLAYDGSLYLCDGEVFAAGTSLLWRALKAAVETGDPEFVSEVGSQYQIAEDGAYRSKLLYAIEVIRFEKAYAKSGSFDAIVYPKPIGDLPWLVWD